MSDPSPKTFSRWQAVQAVGAFSMPIGGLAVGQTDYPSKPLRIEFAATIRHDVAFRADFVKTSGFSI